MSDAWNDNRCDLCGRFMKHHWTRDSDEPDAWYDYWTCQPKCMAEWRRQNQEIENRLAVEAFNRTTPIGSPVRYWTMAREGEGRVSVTRSEAQLLSGHTPVVWVEGHSGCIALTHVDAETAILAAADTTGEQHGCGERLAQRFHEFEEDADDASMCLCGVPALTHAAVEPVEPWHQTPVHTVRSQDA